MRFFVLFLFVFTLSASETIKEHPPLRSALMSKTRRVLTESACAVRDRQSRTERKT